MPTCPHCGATTRPGDRRCGACGATLGDPARRDGRRRPGAATRSDGGEQRDGAPPASGDGGADPTDDHEEGTDAAVDATAEDADATDDADDADATGAADVDATDGDATDVGSSDGTGDADATVDGVDPDAVRATADELGARAAGTPPTGDDAYMAPPGEWTPPGADATRTRPAVEPLGAAATLRWAAGAVAGRPVAAAPFLVAGLAGSAAAGAAYGLAVPAPVLSPRPSAAAALLSALAAVTAAVGTAPAALLAEEAVAGGSRDGRTLLTASVRRLRGVVAASVAGAAVAFAGYVFLVLPGIVLGPKVSLAPYAAALDGAGPVESLERSWRRTRGRLGTVAAVWAAAAAVVLVPLVVAPVVGALVVPLPAAVAAVALGRVYLEGE